MITREEIVRDHMLPLDLEHKLEILLTALNKVRAAYGKPMRVTSGYRSFLGNRNVGGAPKSLHMQCLAADFADVDGNLARWCLNNLAVLAQAGLWMEDPAYTPGWVHLQAAPPKSGNRVFKP